MVFMLCLLVLLSLWIPSTTADKSMQVPQMNVTTTPKPEATTSILETTTPGPDTCGSFKLQNSSGVQDEAVFYYAGLYGYKIARYFVVAGRYTLTLHRILNANCTCTKGAVLFIHGIFASSLTWLLNSPENNIAFILAANCYDVWLLNTRGSAYSLKYDGSNFIELAGPQWDFTWADSGTEDIPATINFIRTYNNNSKIVMVAHSMGGSAAAVYASTMPADCKEKVSLLVLFAPAIFMAHSLFPAIQLGTVVLPLFQLVDIPIPDPCNALAQYGGKCSSYNLTVPACNSLDNVGQNQTCAYLTNQTVSTLNSEYSYVTSLKCIDHFIQVAKYGVFGPYLNLFHSLKLSKKPPSYNFNAISVDIAMFVGLNDSIVSIVDQHEAAARLNSTGKLIYYEEIYCAGHTIYQQCANLSSCGLLKALQLIVAYSNPTC